MQDTLVAIRNRTSLDGCERERRGNHESVLLSPAEVVERFPDDRDAVARTVELAQRLEFDLTQELGYCAACMTRYLEGDPDHRDPILGDVARQTHMLICCSRAKSDVLVLDL